MIRSRQFESEDMGLKNFLFVDQFAEPDEQDVLVGLVPSGVASSKDLLEAVKAALLFPSYFGCNWNALYDCLRDFEWVSQKTVVLAHRDLPNLPKEDLKTYLEVLRDASEDWQPGEAHELRIVLPLAAKSEVIRLLSDK
jgi:RNAse (barnase) inhibitor barstar